MVNGIARKRMATRLAQSCLSFELGQKGSALMLWQNPQALTLES